MRLVTYPVKDGEGEAPFVHFNPWFSKNGQSGSGQKWQKVQKFATIAMPIFATFSISTLIFKNGQSGSWKNAGGPPHRLSVECGLLEQIARERREVN